VALKYIKTIGRMCARDRNVLCVYMVGKVMVYRAMWWWIIGRG